MLSVLLWVAAGLVMLGWVISRIFTDRWLLTQWMWWLPGPGWLGGGAALVILAFIFGTFTARRGRKKSKHPWRAAIALGVVGSAAYTGVFELNMGHTLWGPKRKPNDVGVVFWNSVWDLFHDVSPTIGSIRSDVILIANPPQGTRKKSFREQFLPARVSYVGRFMIVSEFEIIRYGSTPLGLKGDLLAWTGEIMTDEGAAAFVELDTTQRLGRPIVVWLIDLPSDPKLHRRDVTRTAAATIAAWRDVGFPEPDLIAGDFNIPRGSGSIGAITGPAEHAFDQAGWGWSATWPRRRPMLHIDHIFTNPPFRVTSHRVEDAGDGKHKLVRVAVRNTDDNAENRE